VRSRRTIAVAFAPCLLLSACHSGAGPQGLLAGHWYGSSTYYSLTLDMTDANGTIGGSGTLGGAGINGQVILITVTGAEQSRTFDITLSAPNHTPATYGGTVPNDTTMTGTINGSGFTSAQLSVYRQH